MTLDGRGGLGSEAWAIVEAARAVEDPSAEDVARLRGRIFAHLGVAAAAGAAAAVTATEAAAITAATSAAATGAAATAVAPAATASAVATTATAGAGTAASTSTAAGTSAVTSLGLLAKMTLTTKVGLAVLALGAATTAGVVATIEPVDPPAQVASATATAGPSVDATTRSPAELAPDAADPPVPLAPSSGTGPARGPGAEPGLSEEPDAPIAPIARSGALPSSGSAAPPDGAAATDLPPDPLAEETALLGRAQSALAAGRHGEAQALLDEHARRFPGGVLAQEREGARWLSLCAADRDGGGRRDAARPAVEAFLLAHPSSPLAARLRAACGIGP